MVLNVVRKAEAALVADLSRNKVGVLATAAQPNMAATCIDTPFTRTYLAPHPT